MVFFALLGAVVLLAIIVVGFLFYLLHKESKQDKIAPSEIQANPEPLPAEPVIPDEYVMKEAAYQKRVAELEQELQDVSQKVQQQSNETLAMIEGLKKENEQLKSERNNQGTAAEANLIKAQETIETLREEQAGLQTRLSESQAQAGQLKEEAVLIKKQIAQEAEAKAQADKLLVENQTPQPSLETGSTDIAKNFQEEMNKLKQENETLQWEMTKVRAHVTGLERIGENYQQQLKEALSHNEEYSRLSETNNRLQSVLEQLQQENQELTKREKLCQFELEKNRNQLVTLERDYEHLKATMNQSHP